MGMLVYGIAIEGSVYMGDKLYIGDIGMEFEMGIAFDIGIALVIGMPFIAGMAGMVFIAGMEFIIGWFMLMWPIDPELKEGALIWQLFLVLHLECLC